MENATDGLEIKATAGAAGTPENMFDHFMSVFEEFKHTNDERLAKIEHRGTTDPLIEEKLARINAALDAGKSAMTRAAIDRARPALDGKSAIAPDEYSGAFAAYVKRGEAKALSAGSNPDGGYLVPDETETEISRLLKDISPDPCHRRRSPGFGFGI